MPCIEITFPWEINGACVAELEARVTYDYSPGTKDYFCASFGNWLPGDPEEVELEKVELIEVGMKRPRLIPCPDWLEDLISDYAMTNCMEVMAENGREYLYERHVQPPCDTET
jgi:hypothetical protein